ncbi:uncharacterized protein LOC115627636 [Scaptodrosophila lebanonensis]|uniref:Uncharacterized protein LOC115627636 n=1 Tax=Drosophila lebanonensis TaxID=7225 RepID=A0A6J2TRF1_DROLE|nr:uncharacterized protein LOC115627636 [Scaptodrosophila lebanonensis]
MPLLLRKLLRNLARYLRLTSRGSGSNSTVIKCQKGTNTNKKSNADASKSNTPSPRPPPTSILHTSTSRRSTASGRRIPTSSQGSKRSGNSKGSASPKRPKETVSKSVRFDQSEKFPENGKRYTSVTRLPHLQATGDNNGAGIARSSKQHRTPSQSSPPKK